MLRRKLMARLGPLVLAFVAATIVAVMMLQSVLRDLAHLTIDTAAVVDGVYELGAKVSEIRFRVASAPPEQAPDTAAPAADARQIMDMIARSALVAGDDAPAAAEYGRIARLLPAFLASAAGAHPGGFISPADEQLTAAIADLASASRRHIIDERAAVRDRLRHIVLGIALVALVMLNAAVLLLLHTAGLVLRPVDQLIEATGEISREHFDYRLSLGRNDEFDQLAESYNAMAGQLALNEQRKIETLQQVAVALNHDLNNVLSIITLQLTRMGRQSEDNPALRQQLQTVQGNLSRMAETIQSLGRIRRIVLTEYLPGQQMLDLTRSLEPAPPPAPPPRSTP